MFTKSTLRKQCGKKIVLLSSSQLKVVKGFFECWCYLLLNTFEIDVCNLQKNAVTVHRECVPHQSVYIRMGPFSSVISFESK